MRTRLKQRPLAVLEVRAHFRAGPVEFARGMSPRPTTATEQHVGKLIFIAYVFAEHVVVIVLGRDPLFAQFALHLHEFLNAVAVLLHQGDEMVDEFVFALVGLASLFKELVGARLKLSRALEQLFLLGLQLVNVEEDFRVVDSADDLIRNKGRTRLDVEIFDRAAALGGDRTDAAVTHDDAAARDIVNERAEESPVDDCRHADGEAHEQNPHPRRRDIGYDVRLT